MRTLSNALAGLAALDPATLIIVMDGHPAGTAWFFALIILGVALVIGYQVVKASISRAAPRPRRRR